MGIFSKLLGSSGSQVNPAKIKAANMRALKSLNIVVPDHLPILENLEELTPIDSITVARRCAVLTQVIGVGFGAETKKLKAALLDYNIMSYASGQEKDLVSREQVTEQEKIDAEWLVECMQAFAWCLSLAEIKPLQPCDDNLASCLPSPHEDPSKFINESKLRPFKEIYAQADYHYRLHWAVKNALVSQAVILVSESIVRERRRALDWVIGVEANWDEVPSGT